MPNDEVEDNGTNNDDSTNMVNRNDDVTISVTQCHENVSTEIFEENEAQVAITSEIEETRLGVKENVIEETAPAPAIEETTSMITEVSPII